MPFGLCNAPGTFQRCMELVLRGLQWHTPLIYVDDVIICGSSVEEHLDRLDEVLTRFGKAGMKLKPSKVLSATRAGDVLGICGYSRWTEAGSGESEMHIRLANTKEYH